VREREPQGRQFGSGRMRVIMVNKLFAGYLGGVERYIASLSRELQALGVDVAVCAKGKDGIATIDGLTVHTVSSLSGLRRVIESGADVVHAHLPRKVFSFEGLRIGHAGRRRTIFTPHAFYPGGSVIKKMGKLALDLTMTRHTMRICDAVINLTPQDQRDAVRNGLPRHRSHIVPNSISAKELAELESASQGSRPPVDAPYILHVGRFDPVKNIGFLVRAHRAVKGLSLVLIGQDDGELANVRRTIAQHKLESRVHIIERADRATLIAAYANASAVVLSSRWEGLPTVLLEGLFFRKPFVASDVGGNGWLAERGASGFLYPLDDEDAYLTALARALAVPPADLERSRNLVVDEFSWEANAKKLLSIYSATG